jgi:predicted nuclease of restriction endonuclease-like (RecB) superfamily
MKKTSLKKTYISFISDLKNQIKTSQVKAVLAVNRELILLYFKIGKAILEKETKEGWGTKITERISRDLQKSFPKMKGLSHSNIRYMKRFAEEICLQTMPTVGEQAICQQPAGKLEICQQETSSTDALSLLPFFQIPWWHNVTLLDQVSEQKQRLWYANQTIVNGWSRSVLINQIKSHLYRRQVSATKSHNFDLTLPKERSELVEKYNFDFLCGDLKEKELEDSLVENVTKFLLELGRGFSFVGKQYQLTVGGKDFFVDLLFYNFELRCFIVVELKTGEFKPEYTGKLAFYLSALDEKLKHEQDQGAIGIILCSDNNKEITKHATRYIMKPIGISEYKTSQKITDKRIKKFMPSVEELTNLKAKK